MRPLVNASARWVALAALTVATTTLFLALRSGRPLLPLLVKENGDDHSANVSGEYGGPWWTGATPSSMTPLFYNRVPKSGSETLVLLLKWLQAYNNFKHISLTNGHLRRLDAGQQGHLVDEVRGHMKNEGVPMSFDRHVYFIDFTQFGEPMPVYINLVRDPVEKAISRFFYHHIGFSKGYKDNHPPNVDKEEWKRQVFEKCVRRGDEFCQYLPGHSYDLSVPYFCGHDPRCMILNDPWALQEAKKNLDAHFTVVGVLEDLNKTMAVLQHKLPHYFSGIAHMFYNELLGNKMNRNLERPRGVSKDIQRQLSVNLSQEYQLYDFARKRLSAQFSQIQN